MQGMQARFQVNKEEAVKFSQVWTQNGIAVPLLPVHCAFAADFANVVLANFIEQCQTQARAAQNTNKAALTTTTPGKPLIIEG